MANRKKFLFVGALSVAILATVWMLWNGGGDSSDLHQSSAQYSETEDLVPLSSVVSAGDSEASLSESSPVQVVIKEIEFPSGWQAEVNFRPAVRVASGRDLPDNIAESYQDLETRAAAGDAFAAVIAHRSIAICAASPARTKEDLNNAINRTMQTLTVEVVEGGTKSEISAAESAVRDLRWTYEFCDGLSDDQRESAPEWLRRAADLGHPASMKAYVLAELGNSTEGRAYLHSAFEAGYYDSIGTLGLYLVEGERYQFVAANDEYEHNDHSNKALGYAYYYLYLKLAEVDGKYSDRSMEYLKQYLVNDIDPYVQPEQREEGIRLAEEILADNEACCMTVVDF